MSSREDTPEPGTSAASSARENPACPACRHIGTVCTSSCRHCFCQLCLWDWSLGEAACPRCRRPTRHPYPQHVALYHEVQDLLYRSKRRRRSRSRRLSHGGPWEGRRRRSVRWPGNGSPRRRWWQHRRAQEDARGEGRDARFEQDMAASSRGSRCRRSWSRQERPWGQRRWSRGRERWHGWHGRRGTSSRRDQDAREGSEGQRHWRSWNADGRHAPRPQCHGSSGRSETHRWEGSDAPRDWHARRRRSQGRSHGRGRDTCRSSEGTVPHECSRRQRRWRSWSTDQGRAPRCQRSSSGRSRSRARRRDS